MSTGPYTRQAPLRGIILRDDDDQVIVQANRAELRRFAPQKGQPVEVQAAEVRMRVRRRPVVTSTSARTSYVDAWAPDATDETVGRLRAGEFLYDQNGHRVATITDIEINVEQIDITSFGDTSRHYIQGLQDVQIRARGVPGVRVV